jgi:hypothetical protein
MLVLPGAAEVQTNIGRTEDGVQIDAIEPNQGQQRGLVPVLGQSERIISQDGRVFDGAQRREISQHGGHHCTEKGRIVLE